jgi:outer membrane protein TolC
MYRLALPRVTPGLPSQLLERRPDIREAEANLASADAMHRLFSDDLAHQSGGI